MKAVIVTNGVLENYDNLKEECSTADFVICADGGAKFIKSAAMKPDYLIGDFDSIENETLEYFIKIGVNVLTYPAEKDYTDTEICINKAIELGCNQICIVAGIGGRLDHSLGNIGLLHRMQRLGIIGWIAADEAYIYLCSGTSNEPLVIDGKIGTTISIIPFMGDVEGVTLEGLKYPLNDAFIEFGKPIGISNEMLGTKCSIRIKKGELLVIKQLKM